MADDDNVGGEVAENEEYSRKIKQAKVEDDESKDRDIDMADDNNIDGEVAKNEEDLRTTKREKFEDDGDDVKYGVMGNMLGSGDDESKG